MASHHLVSRTAPCGRLHQTPRALLLPYGELKVLLYLYLLGHISSSCALGCCYKRQLKIIVLICVPVASEVKTWQYTFDLELLCNLSLFLLLTLLNYQKNDYILQRYTATWIWTCRSNMVYLHTIKNSYNDRITHLEHSHVMEKLLSYRKTLQIIYHILTKYFKWLSGVLFFVFCFFFP